MARPTLQIELDSPDTTVATFGQVVIVAVLGNFTQEGLRASVAANQRLALRHPAAVGSLSFVRAGATLPDAALRNAAAKAVAQTRANTCCAAQVLGGEGFWSSAVRSVITALERLNPDAVPRRTFAALPEASVWLAARLGHDAAWASALSEAALGLGSAHPLVGEAS